MKRRKLLTAVPLLLALALTLPPTRIFAEEAPAQIAAEPAGTETAPAPAVETVAGTGNHGAVNNDLITSFNLPGGIAGYGGSIFVADTYNNLIREFDLSSGQTRTLTGSVLQHDVYRFPSGGHKDGAFKDALLNRPSGIVRDKFSDRLYIADSANNVIRAADIFKVTTYSGGSAGYADGYVTEARFNYPTGLALDGGNNLYVADTLNNVIRKIDTKGNVTTVAGVPGSSGYQNGVAGQALFNAPTGIAVSEDGHRIYVADTGNHRVRLIRGGIVTTYSGAPDRIDQDGEPWGDFLDGARDEAMFNSPAGLVMHGENLIVADTGNNRVRLITETEVTTLAGSGEPGSLDGAPLEAAFNMPTDVFVLDGVLYIADTGNNQIRKLTLS